MFGDVELFIHVYFLFVCVWYYGAVLIGNNLHKRVFGLKMRRRARESVRKSLPRIRFDRKDPE